jgi:hypothetical protein
MLINICLIWYKGLKEMNVCLLWFNGL